MQINSTNGGGTCTVNQGSQTIVAAAGVAWNGIKKGCIFTVYGSGVPYFLASDASVNGAGQWQATLSGAYADVSNATAVYALARDFTPNYGLTTFSPGDTEMPTLVSRNAAQTDAALRQNQANGPQATNTFTPAMFSDATADDTTAVQAAIAAASAAAPAELLLTRAYRVSAPLTGSVAITIRGVHRSAGIISTVPTGDIFTFAPAGEVNPQDVTTGIQGLTFRDFFIDASVVKTSGAAIHATYTDSTTIDNVRIGTPNLNTASAQINVYDAIFLDKQSNCHINHPQYYASHTGLTVTGATAAATAWFSFGGWIGGGGFCYGNFATPSIGIHVAGLCGGFELGDFDCGQWGKYSLLCDTSLGAGTNHELFIGRVFLDSPGVCGAYIASNSLNILKLHNGWIAGAGRLPGLSFGTGQNPENGVGLYIQKPQASLRINVSAGSNIYDCFCSGIVVEDCYGFTMVGANSYLNGQVVTTSASYAGAVGNGVDIQGGNNVLLAWNDLTQNAGSPWSVRASNSSLGYLGCQSYNISDNSGGGCSTAPVEESAATRSPAMYAGRTMGFDKLSAAESEESETSPQETILPNPPFAIPSGGYAVVSGLRTTIPSPGRYRVYATIRYSIQTSSGDGFLAGQLAVNGVLVGGASWVRLITDLPAPGTAQGTANLEWTNTFSAGDILDFQIKRDGSATWTSCNLASDGNGVTLLGFYQIP